MTFWLILTLTSIRWSSGLQSSTVTFRVEVSPLVNHSNDYQTIRHFPPIKQSSNAGPPYLDWRNDQHHRPGQRRTKTSKSPRSHDFSRLLPHYRIDNSSFFRRSFGFDDDFGTKDDIVDNYRYWPRPMNSTTTSTSNIHFPSSESRKLEFPLGKWNSRKDIDEPQSYFGNRRNRKFFVDDYDDFLGSEDKHGEMRNRKYIHEHEGFYFPLHFPSHHEKEDHLLPLLLLLLLPLLLFAIIIPLNANLLSTLFLIMQNSGATAAAAQLAAGRRKKRQLPNAKHHPALDNTILEVMAIVDSAIELFRQSEQ